MNRNKRYHSLHERKKRCGSLVGAKAAVSDEKSGNLMPFKSQRRDGIFNEWLKAEAGEFLLDAGKTHGADLATVKAEVLEEDRGHFAWDRDGDASPCEN